MATRAGGVPRHQQKGVLLCPVYDSSFLFNGFMRLVAIGIGFDCV